MTEDYSELFRRSPLNITGEDANRLDAFFAKQDEELKRRIEERRKKNAEEFAKQDAELLQSAEMQESIAQMRRGEGVDIDPDELRRSIEMRKMIVTTRTVTVTQRVPLADYGTEDPNEAIAYEKDMPDQEKIEAFVQALEFSEPKDVVVREQVWFVDDEVDEEEDVSDLVQHDFEAGFPGMTRIQ